MADLTYPFPRVSEVHTSEYLFETDRQQGRAEGRKARPVLIIAAGAGKAVVLANTTKGELDGRRMLAIPADVAGTMGLPRASESAVLVDDANIFEWVGYDIRPVPGRKTSCFGRSPPGFVVAACDRFLNAGRAPISR